MAIFNIKTLASNLSDQGAQSPHLSPPWKRGSTKWTVRQEERRRTGRGGETATVKVLILMAMAMPALSTAQTSSASVQSTPTAATPPSTQAKPTADSQSGSNVDLSFGYTDNYAKKSSQMYYNIAVFGQTLDSYGQAPKFASLSTSGLADPSKYNYFLNATQGATTYGGQLLQAAKTLNLPKNIGVLRPFNLIIGVDTQLNSINSTTYVAGIEQAKPVTFSFLSSAFPEFNGYAVFGFADERLNQTAVGATTSSTTDQYGPTLRGILGRQFVGSKPKAKDPKVSAAFKVLAAQYKNVADMQRAVSTYSTSHSTGITNPTPEQTTAFKGLLSAYESAFRGDTPPDQNAWDGALTKEQQNLDYFEQSPFLVIWADGNARYALANVQGGRLRDVFSLNAKFYLDPDNANSSYIQAQYLNGFQEATPTARSNEFQVLLGIKF